MNARTPFTQKLYYKDQYQKQHETEFIEIRDNCMVLRETIAYPEGGGQEGDHGWIHTPQGDIPFQSTTLVGGTPIDLPGFKGGKQGGIILHHLPEDAISLVKDLKPGMPARIHIDVDRRQQLTLSHTASHFLYAAALSLRPELDRNTLGCHIKTDSARFDFFTETPFTTDDIRIIEQLANDMMAKNKPITMEAHRECPDARTWLYEDIRIPCGGTHLQSPEDVRTISVKRKKLGKNKERLTCSFPDATIRTSCYHD